MDADFYPGALRPGNEKAFYPGYYRPISPSMCRHHLMQEAGASIIEIMGQLIAMKTAQGGSIQIRLQTFLVAALLRVCAAVGSPLCQVSRGRVPGKRYYRLYPTFVCRPAVLTDKENTSGSMSSR